mgnify:CR=1 FL=1
MKHVRYLLRSLPSLLDTEMKRNIVLLLLAALLGLRIVMLKTAKEEALSPESKTYLLNLARQTLIWRLRDNALPNPSGRGLNPEVRRKAGCFVTLSNKQTGLRGCIGIFERTRPLYKNVISRAVAASQDSRFISDPVSYEEMKDIIIEISVLTEPKDLGFNSPQDLLAKLRPGIDGVVLFTRYGSSTYLPQVWKSFPGKEAFLSSLCEKHGAPADTWLKEYNHIKVQTYQALVFGEEVSERNVAGPQGAVVGKDGAMVLGVVEPLPRGVSRGKAFLKQGSRLPPATIVTWVSDISESAF